jgi:hypothetical protein
MYAKTATGSTEWQRIDNFVSEEINDTVKALAADPLPEDYPDALKELIRTLFLPLNNKINNKNNIYYGPKKKI